MTIIISELKYTFKQETKLGTHAKYDPGYKFKNIDGIEFEIVKYVDCKNVLVRNIISGEESWTKNEEIQGKRGKGCTYQVKTKRNPAPVVGQEFESENHGRCTILDIYGYLMTIKFHNTGNIKHNVYRATAYSGKVADPEIGPIAWRRFRQRYAIGKIFSTKEYGDIEIVDNSLATNMAVKWLDTGTVQYNVVSESIKSGSLKDTNNPDRIWNYLKIKLDTHYVYVAIDSENTIVYVGKGINKRYTHVKSGTSHNRDLNKHYFCFGNDLEVRIIQYYTTESEAKAHEEYLIKFLQPIYNVAMIPEN